MGGNFNNIIIFDKIVKSINDKRKYDTTTLNNGLRVIVVHDSEGGNSAAALSINVGSLHNKYVPNLISPNEIKYEKINGLAHFLEHMLFMGSRKYPDETIYSKMISKYGGVSNAYTDMNHTCYYFSSVPDAFEKILDIFAQFFIDPSLSEPAIMREMNSVQEEHNKNYNNDSWRELQILRNISKGDHVWNGFATGSLNSLKVKDIRGKIMNFFKGYYCPQNMFLVLYSTHSTNDLLVMANRIFSLIPFREPLTTPKDNELPYDCHKVVLIAPVHTKNSIRIVWQIPNFKLYIVKYRDHNPINFIAYIIGQKTNGSIYEYLRKNNLATRLIIEPLQYINDVFLFSMEIYLTPEGSHHKNYVINLVYKYIDIIRQNSILYSSKIKDIYDEVRFIKEQDILYKDKVEPLEFVKNTADTLSLLGSDFPIGEVLVVGELLCEYTSDFNEMITEILKYFKQDNSIVSIISKNFEGILLERDPWYNCEYQIYDKVPYDSGMGGINEGVINLSLPDKNTFICRDNKLIKGIKPYKYPIRISSFKYYELWYQFTNQFSTPYVNVTINLTLPKLKGGVSIYLAFKIYLDCVIDEMNARLYECNMCNYETELLLTQFNLTITINGPCEKIGNVVDMLTKNISRGGIQMKTFLKIKRRFYENLINNIFISPYEDAIQELLHNIEYNYYVTKDMLKGITNIDYKNILGIKNIVFSKMLVKGMISGNILLGDAIQIANKFKHIASNNDRINYDKIKLIKELRGGSREIIKTMSGNSKEFNSAVGIFYNIGYVHPVLISDEFKGNWNYKICLSNLVHSIVGNEYINQLRTGEQLGYVVTSDLFFLGSEGNPLLAYAFIIQSSTKDSNYLVSRTEKFIEDIRQVISDEKEDDLLDRKKSLIELLLRPPENLKSFTSKNLNKAFNTENVMNFEDILIETYKKITIYDLLVYYDNYIYDRDTRSVWIVQVN